MENKKSFIKIYLLIAALILIFGFIFGILFYNGNHSLIDIYQNQVGEFSEVATSENTLNAIDNGFGVLGRLIIWETSLILAAIFFVIYYICKRREMIINYLSSNNNYQFNDVKELSKKTKITKSKKNDDKK